jgi:hypothetical protein
MNLLNFTKGLEILKPYFDDYEGYHIGAGHEIFYVYPTDHELKPDDVHKLLELGWFQELGWAQRIDAEDADSDCVYDPKIGWSAYV